MAVGERIPTTQGPHNSLGHPTQQVKQPKLFIYSELPHCSTVEQQRSPSSSVWQTTKTKWGELKHEAAIKRGNIFPWAVNDVSARGIKSCVLFGFTFAFVAHGWQEMGKTWKKITFVARVHIRTHIWWCRIKCIISNLECFANIMISSEVMSFAPSCSQRQKEKVDWGVSMTIQGQETTMTSSTCWRWENCSFKWL